ncbi:MetQ/NlpA family ABC transporter substrate-binding protein [Guggenheimella bovis]
MKKIALLLAILLLLTSCGGTKANEGTTLKVGVVGTNEKEIWDFVKEKVKKEGIDLEVVVFTEYSQPNRALKDGDLDLNAFQHYIFLNDFNAANGESLVAIGETFLSPLGAFSKKVKSLEELKKGDTVAIPNDPTNLGRALKLLESAGVIEVDPTKKELPTVNDIVKNPLELKISELDAAQTPRVLDDVTVSIITGGIAVDSGLIPEKDAIYLEKLTKASKPYINVIVSRKDDKRPEFDKIVKAFQADDTAKVITEASKGANIPIWKLNE